LTLAAASILPAAWHAALHCDEFVVLRHVTNFAAGTFTGSSRPGLLFLLMSPVIWLQDAVSITLVSRLIAAASSTCTLVLVWHLVERWVEQTDHGDRAVIPWGSIAAVGLLVTSLDWQGHSFEIRTDTFVMPLTLLVALWLWREEVSPRRALAVGALVAATGLISQKSLYNAVGLALGWGAFILASRGPRPWKRYLRTAAISGAMALFGVGLWYGLMSLGQDSSTLISSQVTGASKTAFTDNVSMQQKLKALGIGAGLGPALWGLGGLGILWAVVRARIRPQLLAMAVLFGVMLATIRFHRGFFLYFIASFEPYLAVLAGGLVASVAGLLHRRLGWLPAVVLVLALVAGQGYHSVDPARALLATNNQPQLQVLRDVSEAFPQPVPYWDMIGMVPGYTETTFFGTALNRRWFRQSTGKNGLIERARRSKPRFFIRNYMSRRRYLRGAERQWLWTHYLPYRPNIYIHGGRMKVGTEPARMNVEILVDGDYTVWFRGGWKGEAAVDGVAVEHGQVLQLSEGHHVLSGSSQGSEGQLWLMLGAERVPYAESTGEQRDYSMFTLLRRARYQQYDDKKGERSDLRTPDHDPTIGRTNAKKRLRRHRRWHEKVDRQDGRP